MRSILSFFSFYGRARRRVYGAFSLATIPVFIIFAAAASVAVLQIYSKDLLSRQTKSGADLARSLEGLNAIPHQAIFWTSIVSGVAWLVMCVAWFALSVRRLHDMGGTGWITIAFIPFVFLLSLVGYFSDLPRPLRLARNEKYQ